MNLFEDLVWRGLVDNISHQELIDELNKGEITFYIGIDPSADSLHIGHLCSLLTAKRLQLAGHKAIVIAGGGTGLIGDPKPNAERPMISIEEIKQNIDKIKIQMKEIIDCSIVNNYDWLSKFDIITFLRDYGKHFNINYMLAKETIKRRLEVGITYTEFSYMLLQSVDYLELYKRYNCRLQIGGQDQWGNITAGMDLINKLYQKANVYAYTIPLIVKADGSKFGKTEKGTVWLDKTKTTPYELYQFFFNTEDDKVIEYLKKFTFLSKEEIEVLEEKVKENPELREAQKRLALELVTIIHGQEASKEVIKITEALFNDNITSLTEKEIKQAFKDVPSFIIEKPILLIDLLVLMKIASSKREARELIFNNAIMINNQKEIDLSKEITKKDLLNESFLIIRKGKKHYFLVKWKDM